MAEPIPAPARYSRGAVIWRLLAALAVIAVSIGARELLLEGGPSDTKLRGARVLGEYSIESELIGERLPVRVVVPRGAVDGRRSLLVFLHGRGDDERTYLDNSMFEALAAQGGRAPVVAFPAADPDSYWHDRDSGQWGSYVLDELVPELVERFDIEPERVAIGGISMGGFGAFDIARQRPDLFCAVGGHSPAVWTDADQRAPGAFDDDSDFDHHDVISLVGPPGSPLRDKRVWVDVGSEDPFAAADEELVAALRSSDARVGYRSWPGAHEDSYWDEHWDQYMRFYATALKQCQEPLEPDTKAPEGDASGD